MFQNPRSNSRQVTLKQVTIRSSGVYRCEVSGEAPYFHSAHSEARMEVVCEYPGLEWSGLEWPGAAWRPRKPG